MRGERRVLSKPQINKLNIRRYTMIVERSEYKGNPLLVIKRDENDKFPFSFGLAKAKMILENIDEIKKFVEEVSGQKKSE
jgi:hypothetical protein